MLRNFWRSHKNTILVAIFFIFSLFMKLDKNIDIVSISINCLAIIFGFSFSSSLVIYAQEKINFFMKEKKVLNSFISDTKAYLFETLRAIILIFILSIFTFSYEYHPITISEKNFIAALTIFELLNTINAIKDYFLVYKSTYCNKVRKFIND